MYCVTEGYMDVVALAQLSFPNAVATLGTAWQAEHVAKALSFHELGGCSASTATQPAGTPPQGARRRLPYATDVPA